MALTITGSSSVGVHLTRPANNPVRVVAGAAIVTHNGAALYGDGGLAWRIGNQGTLQGAAYGVTLAAGGTITNVGTASLIVGAGGIGISGGFGSVANDGTIRATNPAYYYAVRIAGAGSVGNGPTVGAAAAILGGVALASGSVSNRGLIDGGDDRRGLYGFGVGAALTVTNTGTITGTEGVRENGFLRLVNGTPTQPGTLPGALVEGRDFGAFGRQGGAVVNAATIQGSGGIGVLLLASGAQTARVTNGSTLNPGATIGGFLSGVYTRLYGYGAPGQVLLTNYGTISGTTDAGVVLAAQSGGVTLINAGRIAGKPAAGVPAVDFRSGNAILAIVPGASFVGTVLGNAAFTDTLDFVSADTTGRITGIGTQFQDFRALLVDPGANWLVGGSNSFGGNAGVTLRSAATLTVGGVLAVGGSLTLAGTGGIGVAPGGVLAVGGTAGAVAGAVNVSAGAGLNGFGVVRAPVRDAGMITARGGTLSLTEGLTGGGIARIDAGSVLSVRGTLDVARVTFLAGGGESLQIGRGSTLRAPLAGFGASASNTLDLVGVHATALSYTTLTPSSGVLDVALRGGGHVDVTFMGGAYGAGQFHFGSGNGGTVITFG